MKDLIKCATQLLLLLLSFSQASKNSSTPQGVWIIDGKDVFYNQIAQITFLCPMRFGKYPLDEHICKLRFGSTNFDINRMTFGETAFTYDENNRNTVLDYEVNVKKLRDQDRIYNYQGSNYSVTGLEMKLKRNYKKFLYVYYLPSGLLVAVSWIGFLISAELVLGRLAILITPLLLLINIFNIITSSSPNAEGITAVAAWMLACLFFVLGSLVGYVFILLKNRKWNLFVRKDDGKLTEENEDEKENIRKGKADFRSEVYDDVFLLVFPIMFLMFNLIYWPICLY